jgi:hypothetical protein
MQEGRASKMPIKLFRFQQEASGVTVDMEKVRGEVRRLITRCQEVTGGIRELSPISDPCASGAKKLKRD